MKRIYAGYFELGLPPFYVASPLFIYLRPDDLRRLITKTVRGIVRVEIGVYACILERGPGSPCVSPHLKCHDSLVRRAARNLTVLRDVLRCLFGWENSSVPVTGNTYSNFGHGESCRYLSTRLKTLV